MRSPVDKAFARVLRAMVAKERADRRVREAIRGSMRDGRQGWLREELERRETALAEEKAAHEAHSKACIEARGVDPTRPLDEQVERLLELSVSGRPSIMSATAPRGYAECSICRGRHGSEVQHACE